jgi:hypothetical protein
MVQISVIQSPYYKISGVPHLGNLVYCVFVQMVGVVVFGDASVIGVGQLG